MSFGATPPARATGVQPHAASQNQSSSGISSGLVPRPREEGRSHGCCPLCLQSQAGLGKHPASAASGLGVQGESSQRSGLRQATWRGHPSEDSDYRLTCLLDGCLGSSFCVYWPPGLLPRFPQPPSFRSPQIHHPFTAPFCSCLCPFYVPSPYLLPRALLISLCNS